MSHSRPDGSGLQSPLPGLTVILRKKTKGGRDVQRVSVVVFSLTGAVINSMEMHRQRQIEGYAGSLCQYSLAPAPKRGGKAPMCFLLQMLNRWEGSLQRVKRRTFRRGHAAEIDRRLCRESDCGRVNYSRQCSGLSKASAHSTVPLRFPIRPGRSSLTIHASASLAGMG